MAEAAPQAVSLDESEVNFSGLRLGSIQNLLLLGLLLLLLLLGSWHLFEIHPKSVRQFDELLQCIVKIFA